MLWYPKIMPSTKCVVVKIIYDTTVFISLKYYSIVREARVPARVLLKPISNADPQSRN